MRQVVEYDITPVTRTWLLNEARALRQRESWVPDGQTKSSLVWRREVFEALAADVTGKPIRLAFNIE